ncbi:endonuclease V [Pundamilia nyererei]|uniref:Endonuclease V n=1 Tax=Pundamilia nyererei TaxID=303518 RepID=A0A9Y6JEY9_9CICH|nr:PREDICTED: endonuclease V [Pundamilia nyererei]
MSASPAEDLLQQWESEQARLRQQVLEDDTEDWQRSPDFSGLERVGGVDLSFIKGDDVNACAQLVVLSYPDLQVLYEDSQMVTLTAPYIAGFLAFRETPFLLEALQRLKKNQPTLLPQVVFVDGNGLFHYRELFGKVNMAQGGSDMKINAGNGNSWLAAICFGICTSVLTLIFVSLPPQIAALQRGGDSFPLIGASGKVLGKALRSSDKSSKPVYVSVGHKISLDTAVRLTHACCRYRVPEPIRQAVLCFCSAPYDYCKPPDCTCFSWWGEGHPAATGTDCGHQREAGTILPSSVQSPVPPSSSSFLCPTALLSVSDIHIPFCVSQHCPRVLSRLLPHPAAMLRLAGRQIFILQAFEITVTSHEKSKIKKRST